MITIRRKTISPQGYGFSMKAVESPDIYVQISAVQVKKSNLKFQVKYRQLKNLFEYSNVVFVLGCSLPL